MRLRVRLPEGGYIPVLPDSKKHVEGPRLSDAISILRERVKKQVVAKWREDHSHYSKEQFDRELLAKAEADAEQQAAKIVFGHWFEPQGTGSPPLILELDVSRTKDTPLDLVGWIVLDLSEQVTPV